METIAQQLGITEFPFEIRNTNGKEIYFETSKGYWEKRKYDSNGNEIYYEDSDGFWYKREYNSNGKQIHYETSAGNWWKREIDTNGKEIYYENSDGLIIDNKPKEIVELTLDQIAEKMGINVSQLRIKD